jgi:transcriptional regulator
VNLYIPGHFATRDRAAIARLMHDHPFATLVTPAADAALVSHLPLIFLPDREPHGTLIGHFARGNPHVLHAAAAAVDSFAIFHGPHAYVSPSWYAEPAAAVPTWNYAVVHAHGKLELASEGGQTRAILDIMIKRFESARAAPWQLGLDRERLQAMVGAIVGFRIEVKRLDAKFKLSQNRTPDDLVRVANALAAEGYAEAEATAEWMRTYAASDDDKG